ncbi:YafY family protein [Sutterella sp.]|uniref:helix-turn-helix transcriptional regulator n=1 Tax=Sutterella sp. TaxID=1981025 RepID=UPI0026E05AAB|nr:WYL domain-containing protein [Sutterella sp.]MDO5531672.1 WYL domain-containing protein [Sutterella sp.]
MSLPDTAAREAFLVIAILRRIPRTWISSTELERRLAEDGLVLNRRRLQRHLKDIASCELLDVECRSDSKPYQYRRSMPKSELPLETMTPSMSLLMRLAEERMKFQLPPAITSALTTWFDAAHQTLRENLDSRKAEWLKKVATVPSSLPMLPPKIRPGIFDKVSEALFRNALLSVKYKNVDNETFEKDVTPLGLVQQDVRLYLVCQFYGYDDIRHLALHRIEDAKVLDFEGIRPKNFSLDKYIASRHFNFSNGGKVKLVLEFTNPQTEKNLKETPLSRDQKITRTKNGGYHLEATVNDTPLIDGWLGQWSEIAGIQKVERIKIEEPEKK